jgi:hypothetical protein
MTSIMQLILFTLGLVLIGFGLFVGVFASMLGLSGDITVGALLMFAGIAQTVYSLGVNND